MKPREAERQISTAASDTRVSTYHLIQHQSQAAAVYVTMTMDMDMDTSLRDRLVCTVILNNRELKQRQRRRQRERHKFAYLVGKNNSFARPARAFFTFVHFVAVVSKTTT